jgi:hypothetical protein
MKDFEHLVRMALLFAVGIIVFLIGRTLLVPEDFGVYGHYRAGALADNRAYEIKYAGQVLCVECHGDKQDERKDSKHAKISCETCHGPLARHATGAEETKPARPDGRGTCVGCHLKRHARPRDFPQIVLADHAGDGPCIECHTPHAPKIS